MKSPKLSTQFGVMKGIPAPRIQDGKPVNQASAHAAQKGCAPKCSLRINP